MVAALLALLRLTARRRWVDDARKRAEEITDERMDEQEGLPASWRDRLADATAWARVGSAFFDEWRMVWKDLVAVFLIAGFVAALVPAAVFDALFPKGLTSWLEVPVHALVGASVDFLTVIGSLGNAPLAALLWNNGVAFGGILAFLYSVFIVPPALRINARYYGWRFSIYLGLLFAVASIVAGVSVHVAFAIVRLIPEERKDPVEMATFGVDYTLFLNLLFFAVAALLVWLKRRAPRQRRQARPAEAGS